MTLYEILEVSENASNEIIEKAYKVLAKKYHPDLQPQEKKQEAENKMKQLNEAYSILSDENKRREYDIKLREKRMKDKLENQNTVYSSNAVNQVKYKRTTQNPNISEAEKEELRKDIEKNMYQQYANIYNEYINNLRYRKKEKLTLKKVKEFFVTIFIMAVIVLVIWFFPPTNKLIMNFYNENFVFRGIIDFIGAIFVAIKNTFIRN